MSFLEFLLIVVIALLVLGPERLSELAVKLGRLSRRARSIYAGIKSEIERELEVDAQGQREGNGGDETTQAAGAARRTQESRRQF